MKILIRLIKVILILPAIVLFFPAVIIFGRDRVDEALSEIFELT